jgi:hypothetical protein
MGNTNKYQRDGGHDFVECRRTGPCGEARDIIVRDGEHSARHHRSNPSTLESGESITLAAWPKEQPETRLVGEEIVSETFPWTMAYSFCGK